MYELVVVGHVTRDLADGVERLGGAAAYAALVAAQFGVKTLVVTAAPPADPLLRALEHPCIELSVQASPAMTTFELNYAGEVRRLWVRAKADSLSSRSLQCGRGKLAYVGPVIGEVEPKLLDVLDAERVVLGIQGWLRRLTRDGEVYGVDPELVDALPKDADVILSEADHPDADALALRLANQRRVVLVTRGRRGVTAWYAGRSQHFAGVQASETDPTGAGDVFGVVYALGRSWGNGVKSAVARAQLAAARSVEGPGLGNLPAVARWQDRIRPCPPSPSSWTKTNR